MIKNEAILWWERLTSMPFVWVPGGAFQMGSPVGEIGRCDDEGPLHEVHVDGFWISRFIVTNAQYRLFRPAHVSGKGGFFSFDPSTKRLVVIDGGRHNRTADALSLFNGPNQPAMGVSWNDAAGFARWLSESNAGEQTFDLPTEAQWEYACRANTRTARFWGDAPQDAAMYANVYDRRKKALLGMPWECHDCDTGQGGTSDVGSFLPNSFGIFDMLGNVWEWCRDIYSEKAYARHSRENPCNEEIDSARVRRVRRGGGWLSCPMGVRSACRRYFSPNFSTYPLGIRLVRTPKT